MGPRLFSLASLALLLLALCRTSSAADEDFDSIVPAGQKAAYETFFDWKTQSVKMAAQLMLVPNASLTKPITDAIKSGVRCAFGDTAAAATATTATFAASVKTAMYGSGAVNDAGEKAVAARLGIDCTIDTETAEEHVCFCKKPDNKVILFCAAQKYAKGFDKADCKDTALAALKLAAPTIGPFYDFAVLDAKTKDKSAMDKIVTGEASVDEMSTADMQKFLCESLKPAVEAKVKALLASDGIYPYAELLGAALVFEGLDGVNAFCADNDLKSTVFGKCLCGDDGLGFQFCIYKDIASDFVEMKFLNCPDGAAPTLDAAKKPAALKNRKTKKAAPAPDGGSTVAPKPATSATTSILPLAPAATAAALLLLRH